MTEADAEEVTTALTTVNEHSSTLYTDTLDVLYTVMGGVGGNLLTVILKSGGLPVP